MRRRSTRVLLSRCDLDPERDRDLEFARGRAVVLDVGGQDELARVVGLGVGGVAGVVLRVDGVEGDLHALERLVVVKHLPGDGVDLQFAVTAATANGQRRENENETEKTRKHRGITPDRVWRVHGYLKRFHEP